jgi:hypothetical protein
LPPYVCTASFIIIIIIIDIIDMVAVVDGAWDIPRSRLVNGMMSDLDGDDVVLVNGCCCCGYEWTLLWFSMAAVAVAVAGGPKVQPTLRGCHSCQPRFSQISLYLPVFIICLTP